MVYSYICILHIHIHICMFCFLFFFYCKKTWTQTASPDHQLQCNSSISTCGSLWPRWFKMPWPPPHTHTPPDLGQSGGEVMLLAGVTATLQLNNPAELTPQRLFASSPVCVCSCVWGSQVSLFVLLRGSLCLQIPDLPFTFLSLWK